MEYYRTVMEKILAQQEDATIITNPKEPARTFFRKISFILAKWKFKIISLFCHADAK